MRWEAKDVVVEQAELTIRSDVRTKLVDGEEKYTKTWVGNAGADPAVQGYLAG